MLKIRQEQFDAFQDVADAAFIDRVVQYLQAHHSEVVVQHSVGVNLVKQMPAEALTRMVRGGVTRARQYGMTWESSLAAFVVMMFVAAPNFDEHPLIQRVLKDEKVQADERINQLWEKTTEQNWDAVRQNYNVDAWAQ